MPEFAYLSTDGEVKIPLRIRIKLGLKDGEKFAVDTRGQNVLLRRVAMPGAEQIREFLAARRQAKKDVIPVRPRKSLRKKIVRARTLAATKRSVGRGRRVTVRSR